ncbi:hypothetical protein [uncultured Dysgonomonas sp.]|uniref:Uncharacterized protein n=1 Tax=uncultured Dysgonomonas sp. TaxID=206096 RepID=A0A212JDL5_9BACT|nr:hypothetical protein [uncultured Dysgonomonas sp.]SBV97498.1 conserved exported hypothetical protein [uncultured Dysgonomonas sp.]
MKTTDLLRKCLFFIVCLAGAIACTESSDIKSLIPDKPSNAPDYFCTWNVQTYVMNGRTPMKGMVEQNLFGKGKYEGWTNFYPKIRKDLIFVMDDSWDVPVTDTTHSHNFGTIALDPTRFPSFKGNDQERLKQLVDSIKGRGWRGAGGWIAAEKAEKFTEIPDKDFWTMRLQESNHAGLSYWKVDWGRQCHNKEWRRMITNLGHQHAPGMWVEHASVHNYWEFAPPMHLHYARFSDIFRTYDVENITAQPVTIQRICDLLPFSAEEGAKGILNCEDEPYIAAGLGCAIGIMRYPFLGNLPDGTPDKPFPEVGRNVKSRIDEVIRGVRWHRIAEPFGIGSVPYTIDEQRLHDNWILHENETWVQTHTIGEAVQVSAPARVSRGMALPELSDSSMEDRPYVLASRYPNGAIALVSVSRTLGREYYTKEVGVTIPVEDIDVPVGIFGYFKDVTLVFPQNVEWGKHKIYAQDLAGDTPVEITNEVKLENNRLIIPSEVIRHVGLMAAGTGDNSDPGLVLRIF